MESGEENNIWKSKLAGAEFEPGENVWENIQTSLDKEEEVKKLKRRLIYFQWTAAAATLLLFGLGYASYRFIEQKQQESIQLSNQIAELQKAEQSITIKEDNLFDQSRERNQRLDKTETDQPKSEAIFNQNKGRTDITLIAKKNQNIATSLNTEENKIERKELSGIKLSTFKKYEVVENQSILQNQIALSTQLNYSNQESKSVIDNNLTTDVKVERKTEVSPIILNQTENALALDEKKDEEKAKDADEKFWTSVGFSAGSFNNITPTNSAAPANTFRSSLAGQTASEESNSPGYTYAVNLLVGAKVSEHWILQGGVSYMNQVSNYSANSALTENASLQVASVNQFDKNKDNESASIVATTPYTVNNSIEMISFPVQAGYIVFEKKWGLIINTGIATDLFLQNTLAPNAENIATTTTGRGSESPYRPINFAGLIGSEISYRFGTQYRISLAPGIRYPFQSIYKDRLDVKSTPLTFDLGLRFKYIFK